MIITPINRRRRNEPTSPLTNIRLSKAIENELQSTRKQLSLEHLTHHNQFNSNKCVSSVGVIPYSQLVQEQKQRSIEYFRRFLQSKKKQLQVSRHQDLLAKKTNANELRRTFYQATSKAKRSHQLQKAVQASHVRERIRQSELKHKSNDLHSNLLLKFRNFQRQYEKYSSEKIAKPRIRAPSIDGYRRVKTEQIDSELYLADKFTGQLLNLRVKNDELKNQLQQLQIHYNR